MSPEALQYLMAGAVIVSAAAVILQAALLFAIYKSSKAMREQLAEYAASVQPLIASAQKTLDQSRKQIADITAKTSEVLDLAKKQLVRADEVLSEAAVRARIQMERADLIVGDALTRVNETVDLFHKGILKPVREINAVAAGIQAGLSFLLNRRRTTVERATSDEEMFI